ncbi:MAG TPA: hypothetical protein VHJ18_19975 [Streptosporangiaceae bacterium]|jgi:hypothetical protein|nr:hypothetical protein [Streptosporangiaceae bacterium]
MLHEALAQHAHRRSLKVQRDIAALQGRSQGKAQRREQFFKAGVGDDTGKTLAGAVQGTLGDEVLTAAVGQPANCKFLTSGSAPGGYVVVDLVARVGEQFQDFTIC